jgi:hypothetical protein
MEISRWMLKYSKAKAVDAKLGKEEKKKQAKLVKDFEAPVSSFIDQAKKLGSTQLTQYQLDYAEGRITYVQLSEAFMVYFVQEFKQYSSYDMTTDRLNTGIALMEEALLLQQQINTEFNLSDEHKKAIVKRIKKTLAANEKEKANSGAGK